MRDLENSKSGVLDPSWAVVPQKEKNDEFNFFINVHGSVHRKIILIYVQQDATLHSLFYLETALHVSVGTITHHQERNTTVSTASGICHIVTATYRYRGRVGTGLNVL